MTAVGRQPALLLAELTWRWCFAAGACFLGALAVLEYLNSIPISWRERLLVESGEPLLALAAVGHAVRGSAGRLAGSAIVAGSGIAVLWILCAALGRLVTLRALMGEGRGAYGPLLGLSFVRAGLFLAAVLAGVGGLILAGFAGPEGDATPSLLLACVLLAGIWLVWALLNWLLSLASVYAVRDARDTWGALAGAVGLVQGEFGEVVLTSLPFVLLHYLALAAAAAAGLLVFDLMTRVSPAAGWALAALAGGYFAYADFLYIARLAAYAALAQGGEAVVQPSPSPDIAPSGPQQVMASQPDLSGSLGLKPEVS